MEDLKLKTFSSIEEVRTHIVNVAEHILELLSSKERPAKLRELKEILKVLDDPDRDRDNDPVVISDAIDLSKGWLEEISTNVVCQGIDCWGTTIETNK